MSKTLKGPIVWVKYPGSFYFVMAQPKPDNIELLTRGLSIPNSVSVQKLKFRVCLGSQFEMINPNYNYLLHQNNISYCLGENKDADQLCSNCTADQHLCFRYTDSTTPLLLISKISCF